MLGESLQIGPLFDLFVIYSILFYFLESGRCQQLGLNLGPSFFQLPLLEVQIDHLLVLAAHGLTHFGLGDDSLSLVVTFVGELLNFLTLPNATLKRNAKTLQLL